MGKGGVAEQVSEWPADSGQGPSFQCLCCYWSSDRALSLVFFLIVQHCALSISRHAAIKSVPAETRKLSVLSTLDRQPLWWLTDVELCSEV